MSSLRPPAEPTTKRHRRVRRLGDTAPQQRRHHPACARYADEPPHDRRRAIRHDALGRFLVNCVRGELINTRALIDAMNPETIDVIENDHRYFHQDHRLDVLNNHDLTLLRSFPNVVVTPHIAFYSDTVTAEMVHCAMEYLRDFSQTGEPLMEVHPD